MAQHDDIKLEVLAAVRDFAAATIIPGNAIASISQLVRATDKVKLSGMDYWEREIHYQYSLHSRLPALNGAEWIKRAEFLSWLELISWDGYKRERTIRALVGAAPNAFFFLMLLRRLNDWVPQVRLAAREKLLEIARATEVEFVVAALCSALVSWSSWGRIDCLDRQVILQLVSEKSVAQALIAKLISSGAGPMPSLFAQLGRTGILDDQLDTIASSAKIPGVRARAYRALFESRIIWIEGRKRVWTDLRYCKERSVPIIAQRTVVVTISILELLIKSAQDKSSLVRRISAEILIRDLDSIGSIAQELAGQFALDESRAVSERGLFALKQLRLI